MSVNHSTADKNEVHYRKIGAVGGRSSHQRTFVGGSGRGGGGPTAPPLSNSSTRSFKKTHNAQSRVNDGSGNAPEFNDVPAAENASHAKPTLHVATSKPNDASTRLIPRAPSPQLPALTPESASSENSTKGGDKGKGFSLQFGSISPGFVNGVPVPPRTTSAPPNLDEQLHDQACHDASGRVAAIPAPSAAKPEMTKKTTAPISQHTIREVNADSKVKRDTPTTCASSVSHVQKPPVLSMGSISMPMSYPQPPVSLQFGGPNPPKKSQGLPAASLPMPMQMPLQMGNPYQVQQLIHLPHHLMQAQGIMHQSQGLGFNPQMGQLPPHSGGLGMKIPSQFSSPQPAEFGSARKAVKITHPETHEELSLEKRSDVYTDGTALKPHNNVPPQFQNVPSYPPNHPIGYYSNSYVGGPAFFGPPSSLSFPSPQLTLVSQASRFNHPVSQAPHAMTFMNQLASNSSTINKGGNAVQGTAESAKSESAREVQHTVSAASVSVTVKAGIGSADKGINSKPVEKGEYGTLNASSCGMQQSTTHSHAEISLDTSSDIHLSTVSDDVNVVIVATTSKRHDSMSSDDAVTKSHSSGVGREETISVSVTGAPAEGQGMETARSISSSGPASNSSIAVSELNKTKSTLARGKKKIKEILQKADAQGTTSDLYMAYKGPEEMKESTTNAVHTENTSSNDLNLASAEFDHEGASIKDKDGGCKAEPEDWEDAVDISTPKLESASKKQGKTVRHNVEEAGTDKKYTRDFLLTFLEQCTNLPDGFETTSDIADILIRPGSSSTRAVDRQLPSPGRIVDRPSGAPRVDRRGGGMMNADRWHNQRGQFPSPRDIGLDPAYGSMSMGFHPAQAGNYVFLRNPHAQPHVQYPILSVPMQSMQRNDNHRWRNTNFRGLMSPPQTPMQIMHKAEKKYEIGKTTDEEEAKQRILKGILNKLTPQNFDKLFAQVKEVNIDNVVTLNGVISQIFDKALTEPTFCEMYSNFCYELSFVLPELSVDDEKITFKRLLLNKCQEEFERGEREEDEANKADTEEEISAGGREERRLKARRRMLGNIRLIGELYKRRMLTEKIMHECIRKLLIHYPDTSEEDIESLCKLMSTIGDMIDNPKGKGFMNGYFELIERLSNNMRLSSRVRFMLKDAIDLRKNKWQERRKVEGPKKIDEVHRDAAQERHAQTTRLSRGPNMGSSMRRGQPMEYVPRGSSMLSSSGGQMANFRGLPSQGRGYGMQAVRMEEKHYIDSRTIVVPLPQKSLGDDSTLGPQGGLAKGMSMRGQPSVSTTPLIDSTLIQGDTRRTKDGLNGFSSVSERVAPNSRDDSVPASPPVRVEETSSAQNMFPEKVWPEERLREKSAAAIKEFYSAKDEKEVDLCVREMNAPSFYPSVISIWVIDSFERKDLERDLLTKLIVNLSKPCDGRLFMPDQLIHGFESVLTNLEDTVNDAPKAPDFLGRLFARVILENIVSLKQISGLLHDGGEEPGSLREAGLAGDVLGSILENIKSEKGEAALKDICSNCNLRLEDFRPLDPFKSKKLELFT